MKLDRIGFWSEIKLEIIRKYVGAYKSAIKNQLHNKEKIV
jgi:hypothetical protein